MEISIRLLLACSPTDIYVPGGEEEKKKDWGKNIKETRRESKEN